MATDISLPGTQQQKGLPSGPQDATRAAKQDDELSLLDLLIALA